MTDKTLLDIDGGELEGGGQILRIASALSAILKKPVRISNIRAGRSQPGLRPQHLTGLQMVRDVCGGRLMGEKIGSTEITLYPGELSQGTHTADTKTAGSVALLLQVGLPCILYGDGPAKLVLKGGTNAEMAPQIDYIWLVFKPIASKMGIDFETRIIRRGYYPKGGGHVSVTVTPVHDLKPIELLDHGQVTKITGRAFVAGTLPIKIAHETATAATKLIRKEFRNIDINIEAVKEEPGEAFGNGVGIIITAETSTGCIFGSSSLGKRGVPSEAVGTEAAEQILTELAHGGCVDSHLQDQLIIFMALANGKSKIKTGPITLHTKTAIHVTQILTNVIFTVTEEPGKETFLIECTGLGIKSVLASRGSD